jgi:MFS family permease
LDAPPRAGSACSSRPAESAPRSVRSWTIAWGYVICGVFFLGASLSSSLPLVVVCLVGSGVGTAITWVFSTVALQQETSDRVRGRVFAAEQSLFTLTVSISMLATGRGLDHPGWTPRGVGIALSFVYFLGAAIFELLLVRARKSSARAPSASP